MRESRSENQRPSFIKIASGAKVEGLSVVNNTGIGNADFINNEGELKNAILLSNKHIVSSKILDKKKWWKKPEIIIPSLLGILSISSTPFWFKWLLSLNLQF